MSVKDLFQSIGRVLNQVPQIEITDSNEPSWADKEIARLAAGLVERRKAAIGYLGEKWILHPVHTKQKLDVGPNTLGRAA